MNADQSVILPLRRLMRGLGRFTSRPGGENPGAVRLYRHVRRARDLAVGGPIRRAVGRMRGGGWPVVAGEYVVGDPSAPVAVCTLTSADLVSTAAALPGVAIAGTLHTVNLGIEQIIANITSNPAIRFLLICGVESPIFHPGQGLRALLRNGVTDGRRIIGAEGHLPELSNADPERIAAFRGQVELIDLTGEHDAARIADAVRTVPPRTTDFLPAAAIVDRPTEPIPEVRPGGKRAPLRYDPRGYFVISLDRADRRIQLQHFRTDNTAAHVMRGRSAEPMLLGLVREGLVSQLSHAGYLGGELAKAETALRLGIRYEQDRPLRAGSRP